MVERAIALGDTCASHAATNGQAAVVSAIILGELEYVPAHRRLSGNVAEAVVGPSDIHGNPRLASMRRTYFEDEVFPVASSSPYMASISDGPGFVMVHRLLRIGTIGTYQKGQGEKGQRGVQLMLRVVPP